MGDGEHPGPEVVFAAGEFRQAVDRLQEDFFEQIVGAVYGLGPQIAKDAGREIPVDIRPSPVGSDSCGRKGRGKV